jgi:hypothetical protein
MLLVADLHHWWKDVFQAPGTVTWTLSNLSEREHYWGFSFRQFQANERGVEILSHRTTSDNNLQHKDIFTVSVTDGNIYRFSAIWVVGT